METFRSRKFIIAALSLVANALLVWAGHISDGVYSAVTIATIGAYLTANVAQKKVTSGT